MSTTDLSKKTLVRIVRGESKHELFQQLMEIGRRNSDDRLNFKVQLEHPTLKGQLTTSRAELLINGIEAEDGSGNCWIISGYINAATYRQCGWLNQFIPSYYSTSQFTGFYNSRTRTGFIGAR